MYAFRGTGIPVMTAFDDATKLACIEREIEMRYKVYPNRVRQGLMAPTLAEREIAIMKAIAQDYRDKLEPKFALEGPC